MNFLLGIVISLIAVVILVLIPWVGVGALGLHTLFGIIIPYVALAFFFVGIMIRVVRWGKSPVPFRIPTTAGQQWSFPWIKQNRIDNPTSTFGVVVRMAFEILLFRSLFRHTRMEFREGPRIGYEWEKWLWIGALAFHYSFLVVILRHLRFFTDPIPYFVHLIESLDGFLEMGIAPLAGFAVPGIMISGLVLPTALLFLFLRRIFSAQVAYLSLPADYFPLILLMAIATTGVFMRYIGAFMQALFKVDVLTVEVVKVKELALGLVTFHPTIPEGIGAIFYIHLFLVSVLLAYFPFSKLVHMAGIFLSPTRNLSNNSRFVRHVNPWDYPVKVHAYEEYEEEFRDKMIEAGLPVEKMPEETEETDTGSGEEEKE
ncbi:MAG: sulfate reduction electron transfer complex DsrMKJOP subunit DsrM [Deltaproteobacteria bacterium]|nr:sulfate reduction electron transfer complex DsrMKJOP subunit DsrM [Deltaproteobacteria bacterium]MBW2136650.1 sulfate reduction electron transfer complex DsrMKJOP subunit DsrM [Deltaproteobacteria bacterium]